MLTFSLQIQLRLFFTSYALPQKWQHCSERTPRFQNYVMEF